MASKRIFDIIFKTKGTDRAKNAVKGIGGALGTLTKVSVLAGAGIAALSVKLAGDFSKNLREVSTLMDNTSEKSIKKMSKELIDAIASGDNVVAQNEFNTSISNKVGDALETRRREISSTYVKTEVAEDDSV